MPSAPRASPPAVHHIELWTHDLASCAPGVDWLLTSLGWDAERIAGWDQGRIWRHGSGVYIVLEQSEHVRGTHHDRTLPGLNHLALSCADRASLDVLRAEGPDHGWRELFAESYPHAGGPEHIAWYAENPQGFEVEVVAPGPQSLVSGA